MRKSTIIAVLAAAFIAPSLHAADVTEADFQKAMKKVQESVGAVRGASTDAPAAAAGAKAVEAALGSVESFWAARKDADAVKMSAAARAAALDVAKAVESKDPAVLGDKTKAMFGTCKACHDVHREQLPDKTYKIK